MNWTKSRSDRFHWETHEAQGGRQPFSIRQMASEWVLLVQKTEPEAPWWEEAGPFSSLDDAKDRAEHPVAGKVEPQPTPWS